MAASDRIAIAETDQEAIGVFGGDGGDMERFTPLFQVKLAADGELLDTRGDVVLLRREDELDVPRAVVSRLEPAAP